MQCEAVKLKAVGIIPTDAHILLTTNALEM
jgi:hypothetical protein